MEDDSTGFFEDGSSQNDSDGSHRYLRQSKPNGSTGTTNNSKDNPRDLQSSSARRKDDVDSSAPETASNQTDEKSKNVLRKLFTTSSQGSSKRVVEGSDDRPSAQTSQSFRKKISLRNLLLRTSSRSVNREAETTKDVGIGPPERSKSMEQLNVSEITNTAEDSAVSEESDNNSNLNIKWLSDDENGSNSANWYDWDSSSDHTDSETPPANQSSEDRCTRRSSMQNRSRRKTKDEASTQSSRRDINGSLLRRRSRSRKEVSQSPCRERGDRPQPKRVESIRRSKDRRSSRKSSDERYEHRARSAENSDRRSNNRLNVSDPSKQNEGLPKPYEREESDASMASARRVSTSNKRRVSRKDRSGPSGSAPKDDRRKRFEHEESDASIGTAKVERPKHRSSNTIRRFRSNGKGSVLSPKQKEISEMSSSTSSVPPTSFPSQLHRLVLDDIWLQDPNMIECRLKSCVEALNDSVIRRSKISDAIIDRLGVAAPIVGAMRKYAVYNSIQREACRLVYALVNRECIALSFDECGIFKQILSAMKAFASDERMQASGCAALHALTCIDNVALSKRLVEEGGLNVIYTAMRDFASSETIQQRGTMIFCCVGEYEELRPAAQKYRSNHTGLSSDEPL